MNKWLGKVSRAGLADEPLGRELISLKAHLSDQIAKAEELGLPGPSSSSRTPPSAEDDEDEDELEDVPEKSGLELGQPQEDVPSYVFRHSERVTRAQSARLKQQEAKSSSSKAEDSGSPKPDSVPRVSFGLDLKYWGREREMELPQFVRNGADSHPFWRASEQDLRDPGAVGKKEAAASLTRLITFTGTTKRPQRECRAPLGTGGLCRRRDIRRCPFHGEIRERDEVGAAVDKSALSEESSEEEKRKESCGGKKKRKKASASEQPGCSSWQDPELLAELEAGTGKQLGLGARKKRARRTKEERRAERTTSGGRTRARLTDKLLSKAAVKRLGQTLDAMQAARNDNKFRHQFNYSYRV